MIFVSAAELVLHQPLGFQVRCGARGPAHTIATCNADVPTPSRSTRLHRNRASSSARWGARRRQRTPRPSGVVRQRAVAEASAATAAGAGADSIAGGGPHDEPTTVTASAAKHILLTLALGDADARDPSAAPQATRSTRRTVRRGDGATATARRNPLVAVVAARR